MDATKQDGQHDSIVIMVDGTEKTMAENQQRKEWGCLPYIAQVIQASDTKKLVHAVKFGLALVLVSLLYMLEVVHDKLGNNAMWAVMTVVVVSEYTVGATVIKGLNRGVGTTLGGGLGCFVALLAQEIAGVGKAVVIGMSIFIFGAAATYMRLVPNIKKKYDYGVLIFILTLSLVSISGVRGDEIIQVASDRLSSIFIGFAISAFTSLFIFPLWAGDELHSLLASQFDCIGHSIEDFLDDHIIQGNGKKGTDEARKLSTCFSVLSSKTTHESLANFARWEPWHGRFGFHYPWNKYLEIARLLRELAANIITAEGYMKTKLEVYHTSYQLSTKELCKAACSLLAGAMRELGGSILHMKQFQQQEIAGEAFQEMRAELSAHIQVHSSATTINHSGAADNGMKCSGVHSMVLLVSMVDILDRVQDLLMEVKELGISAGFADPILHEKS